jgi:oligoribonuclease NrnB/cAMP/cGMP phosphodiesterase (DHH superfamily)
VHYGIYHSRDLDGLSCGAILRHFLPSARLFPYDYGQEAPQIMPANGQTGNDVLYICDVNLPMPQMDTYRKQLGKLVWIDHHVSARQDYLAYTEQHLGWEYVYDVNRAACELSWKYFSDAPLPYFLDLIGSWDVYRHRNTAYWQDEIAPFQYGLRSRCNRLADYPMELFADDNFGRSLVQELQREGRPIMRYIEKSHTVLAGQAFEAQIAGFPAICINQRGLNGDSFNACFRPGRHRLKCAFGFNGKEWGFSIYAGDDQIDCAAIAKQFGGGGHKGAAGFSVSQLSQVFPHLNV